MDRIGEKLLVVLAVTATSAARANEPPDIAPMHRRSIEVRGIYGGVPRAIFKQGKTLDDLGINAVWIGSGRLNAADIALLHDQGARVFAEFNTMHHASYLDDHPDAAPIGPDGQPSPPPEGWQGVCPTHPGYRQSRMDAFRQALRDFEIDGIWLDYHHAHASWERAEPVLPDTCFCDRCLSRFEHDTGIDLPDAPTSEVSTRLLGPLEDQWVRWRCSVFTDWVRQFRAILDETRPDAMLGTFHCPWSESDFEGALRRKLAIDLEAQAPYLDVLSPMPYHARFGHADDPDWISRQVADLGDRLGLTGDPGERPRIWPIVQLSDWGEPVPADQVPTVLDHGTRPPATGVTVFAWGSLSREQEKVDRLGSFYRSLAGSDTKSGATR